MRYVIALFAAAVLFSCKKDKDDQATPANNSGGSGSTVPACETGNYGFLTLRNNTSQSYYFYINNAYQSLVPGNFQADSLHITVGNNYQFKVVRIDGGQQYVTNGSIAECQAYTWSWP